MEVIEIEGGVALKGSVSISGAKNAALPIMAATLLTEGKSILRNVPELNDVKTKAKLLSIIGATPNFVAPNRLEVVVPHSLEPVAPYNVVKQMRASILVLGPLLARVGIAKVSLPGGCAIGARPIDLHLKGLERLGAKVTIEKGYIVAKAQKLVGNEIVLDIPTVTGTENLMMAAVFAKGRTVIVNAAREPEVEELARVLNKMGANINGAGTNIIVIEGVKELSPVDHSIIPDRIETGTFMVASAITDGDILIKNGELSHLTMVVKKLTEAGVIIENNKEGIRVYTDGPIKPVDITTAPYPGFPTDMQAQFMSLMCKAVGRSVITETIFENRFMHVSELKRMGADILINGRSAIVTGGRRLQGATVMATDLRASASLVLAGLFAEGTTEIRRVYHLDRGYEKFVEKLKGLGANIMRREGEP